jgi:hypothetical protein
MKIYHITNLETGYYAEVSKLSAAKKLMVQNNANGTIIKYYSNGDSVDCGEIKINGSNKTYVANTKQRILNY